MTLAPGDTFDRYRIEAVIGAGGMGRVYRAFDPKLRRRVAIKLLHHGNGDSAQVSSVLREAQSVAALDHPGVVSVFDVGEWDGCPFIVMEYVEGRSMRSLIGKVSGGDALKWLADVARALAAAHRAGLVHRDIKPENVMVRDDGVVKLLDFGIARRVDQDGVPSARSGVVGVTASSMAGTPSYMAPEQVQRGVIDARTDQFGWGVLAYELLSGELPWPSQKTGMSSFLAVVTEHQETLPTAALGLPEHVGAVLDRALEKSPEHRFPSMAALLQALDGSTTVDSPTFQEPAPQGEEASAASTVTGRYGLSSAPGSRTAESIPPASRTYESVPPASETHESVPPASQAPDRQAIEGGAISAPQTANTIGRPEAAPAPGDRSISPRLPGRAWTAIALLLLAGIGLAVVMRSASITQAPEAPRTSSDGWKPNPEAVAMYAAGVRKFQAGALSSGASSFEATIQRESGFAAAHLRLAVLQWLDGSRSAGRKSHASASRWRRRLDARDQALLDALEPSFEATSPRHDEALTRLSELERRFRGDAEIGLVRALVLTAIGRDDEGFAAFEAVHDAHPNSATSWLGMALIQARRDDLDKARDAAAKCLEIEPTAGDCVWFGAQLDAHAGRCEDMAKGASRLLELGGDDEAARMLRLQARLARASPTRAVASIDGEIGSVFAGESAVEARFLSAAARVLDGELATADRLLAGPATKRVDKEEDAQFHELRASLAEEIGDARGAAVIAEEFLERRGSLPTGSDVSVEQIARDPRVIFSGLLLASGKIDRGGLLAQRAAWVDAWRKRGVTPNERDLWARGHAGPARTESDAREAIAALGPAGKPRRFSMGRLLGVDAARVYLLAGRPADAVPLLREATSSCLAASDPVRFVQAHALLGRALELQGDTPGACAAHGEVLSRWGKARPRSLTAEDSTARRATLRCPPLP